MASQRHFQKQLHSRFLSSKLKTFAEMQNITLYIIICILLLIIFSFYYGSINCQIPPTNIRQISSLSIQYVIIVLGKGSTSNGTPSIQMKQRIAKAAQVMKQYKFLSFKNTMYIVSGSDGSSFKYQTFNHPTEAQIMFDILSNDHNIPSQSIIIEPNARDTIENFFYSLKILKQANIDKLNGLFIVTSDYHIPRCKHILNVLNTQNYGYFIQIDNIYPIITTTEWKNDEEKEFRAKREKFFMYNSTLYHMTLCQNKLYLGTGSWSPKGNIDVKFDKNCNMIKV